MSPRSNQSLFIALIAIYSLSVGVKQLWKIIKEKVLVQFKMKGLWVEIDWEETL